MIFFVVLNMSFVSAATDPSLKLHYTFGPLAGGMVQDVSGNGNNGTLHNSATVRQMGNYAVLDLGKNNGYLDMGVSTGNLIASLKNFTISTYLYVDESASIEGDGNFLWVFSTSSACTQSTGKYISYRVNKQRYAQSTEGWGNETVVIENGNAIRLGSWIHVVFTQNDQTGTLYLNGEVTMTGKASFSPKDLGTATSCNWIGKPQFVGDNYLKNALLTDFRIYNRSLSAKEILALSTNISGINRINAQKKLAISYDLLDLGNIDQIRSDLKLPSVMSNGVSVTWASSKVSVLTSKGQVVRPSVGMKPVKVKLTAQFKIDDEIRSKTFIATVLPLLSDKASARSDLESVTFSVNTAALKSDLKLPANGLEGSSLTWKSDSPEYFTNNGNLLKLPAKGTGSKTILLTASAKKGLNADSKIFKLVLPEKEGYSSYMFVYFIGNNGTEESLRFALSNDGYNFRALNNNLPVIGSDSISASKGIRDPHILRCQDGKTFYMVMTDMKSANGWNNNHGMVLMKSTDLINWTSSKVDIAASFPEFSAVNRVWAPQTIYDSKVGKYMVYWSMRSGSNPDVIHYAYANADFTAFETTPKILYTSNNACIDGDIIFKDNQYHLFFKTEASGNGIKKAVSSSLTGPYVFYDKYLQQTELPVEGSCIFKLIDSNDYILMYDVYTNGAYEFTKSSDLTNFSVVKGVSMNFAPRHGTVIPITEAEAVSLAKRWATKSDLIVQAANAKSIKKNNIINDPTSKSLFLPVKYGTNLKSFDPNLKSMPGVTISPSGPQDFSTAALQYSLTLKDTTVNYTVSAQINNNPVLDGYYADPEILYSEKTGRFYLYPTSDGYPGWSGTSFKVFSSPDMVVWKDEGVILDLTTTDVTWAKTNAWAPCIIEKKINGQYQYFYYFTAAQKIGVAVSNNPTGPFVDSGKALIKSKPNGVNYGQEIDPDVFTDPKTGKSYLYWGNGYMAGVELNDDMISIKTETMKVITPHSSFREGTYVIYRNGKYYFMWSVDDTGSPNYRVCYGTSESPLGTISVPSINTVIARDDSKAIYGTGHNSVVEIPGTDKWYIVYHRLTRPKGITLPSPGFFREVCIDKLEFNLDGSIRQAQPTLEGISPVTLLK